MSDQSFLEQRLDASSWPIAVGDLVVLVLFLLAGTLHHGHTLADLRADPLLYVLAAGPFLVGWLVCAPLVGAYSPGGGSAPNSSIPLAIRSWVPAALVGLLIRYLALPDRGVTPVFAAVIVVGGTVVLAVWRYLYFLAR
jgi:flagellin-like protein